MTDLLIPQEFLIRFPELDPVRANKYWQKYLACVRKYSLKGVIFSRDDVFDFPFDEAFNYCSSFQYEKIRYWIWKEFFAIAPFFYVVDLGNNFKKKISRVKIMRQDLIEQLFAGITDEELANEFFDGLQPHQLDAIDIDATSICEYLTSAIDLIETSDNTNLINQVHANVRLIKAVNIMAEWYQKSQGRYAWPHIDKPSDYGRVYYSGINVQNVSRTMRRVILGDHVQLDLHAAVFAVKLLLAKDISNELGHDFAGAWTYTKEYLELKTPRRNLLAAHIQHYPDGIKLIKQAISALGFGARLNEHSWQTNGQWHTSAIVDIIKHPDDRKRFIEDPWVINFVLEQRELNKFICDYYKKYQPHIIDHIKMILLKNRETTSVRESHIMAYLYQHTETLIMDRVVGILNNANIKVIARIHDAVLIDRVSNATLQEIKYQLNDIDNYLIIEKSDISAWHDTTRYNNELKIHRQHIRDEEIRAATVHDKPIHKNVRLRKSFQPNDAEGHYLGSYSQPQHDLE